MKQSWILYGLIPFFMFIDTIGGVQSGFDLFGGKKSPQAHKSFAMKCYQKPCLNYSKDEASIEFACKDDSIEYTFLDLLKAELMPYFSEIREITFQKNRGNYGAFVLVGNFEQIIPRLNYYQDSGTAVLEFVSADCLKKRANKVRSIVLYSA